MRRAVFRMLIAIVLYAFMGCSVPPCFPTLSSLATSVPFDQTKLGAYCLNKSVG